MSRLTDYVRYDDAQRHYSSLRLWELFEGTRERLNIAGECIDRHAGDGDRIALRLALADGSSQAIGFRALAELSSRFAHWLAGRGIERGDRVAIMLEPSLAFYAALFGTMKAGAIAVPLFTLFGREGVRLRVEDCHPRLLITSAAKAAEIGALPGLATAVADDHFLAGLGDLPSSFTCSTSADDLAIFQYTSGTTRELPDAIRHSHRAIVVVMAAALYGTGIRPGDRFFCPSSPAWGHGLWHGTLAPLALGVETATMSGRFDPLRMMAALQEFQIDNLSAAATHYRMMKNSGAADRYRFAIRKMSFTGEPIDGESLAFAERTFGTRLCSMYGTTEIGVILADYPGAPDHVPRPGALGKPLPGMKIEVQAADGSSCPPDRLGEIKLWRHGKWLATRDLGRVDADGYFYHGGRADDVIISAGWTIAAREVEDALLHHPAVREAAVIGVPDALRGQIVKAFVVSDRPGDEALGRELQDFVRTRLSRHEYPRQIAFLAELPKTPAGKVNRKALREREAAASAADPPPGTTA